MLKNLLLTLMGLSILSTQAFAAMQKDNSATSPNAATNSPNAILAPTATINAPAGEQQTDQKNDDLVFENIWARPTMLPSTSSAIYMSVKNNTDHDIVLIGVSAIDVANNVELHKTFVDEKGVTRMTPIDKIVIPANSSITLDQGGTHIMLFDLKQHLRLGDKFRAELKFEGMEPRIIEADIKSRP